MRTVTNLARTLRLGWDASAASLLVLACLATASALVPAAALWLTGRLIDHLARSGGVSREALLTYVIPLALLTSVHHAIGIVNARLKELFGWRITTRAQRRFLGCVARLDVPRLESAEWHDRIARASRDLNWRLVQLNDRVVDLFAAVVTAATMLGLLGSLQPTLLPLAALALAPSIALQRRINRRLYEFWYGAVTEERELEYTRDVLTGPRTAKDLRAFGLEEYFLARHDAFGNVVARRMRQAHRASFALVSLSVATMGASLVAGYLVLANDATAGVEPGAFVVLVGAFTAVLGHMGTISGTLIEIEQHSTFLDDYFDLLAAPPALTLRRPIRSLPSRLVCGVRFSDVGFTYDGRDTAALEGVNLHIAPGELLALVGPNGAGKTTLVKLLLRFYDPSVGVVSVDGVDVRHLPSEVLRSRIGVLFQDFAQFELSVRDNVALGRLANANGDGKIFDALRDARADEVLTRLRGGLDSRLGRLFDGATDLSGGEWQRLALARLIFRRADIWVLDEPTAALDPETEAAIFSEFRRLLGRRVGLIISHRFSTVRTADRIGVLEGGRLTELGSHDELLARGGTYSRMFEAQAAAYR